jgi:hypothetical protein
MCGKVDSTFNIRSPRHAALVPKLRATVDFEPIWKRSKLFPIILGVESAHPSRANLNEPKQLADDSPVSPNRFRIHPNLAKDLRHIVCRPDPMRYIAKYPPSIFSLVIED